MKVLTASDLRCPTNGKRMYVDEASADAEIEQAWTNPRWRDEHGRMPKCAYLCPDCCWWHLTHKRDQWDDAA